jgi:hypothetical protein
LLASDEPGWWELVIRTRARLRSGAKKRALEGLMGYLAARRKQVDYARFKACG